MSEKPAIIFITCDEMRLDTLSCYGGTAVDTPNIDSLMPVSYTHLDVYKRQASCKERGK